jgi:putative ABC transport system permease protein
MARWSPRPPHDRELDEELAFHEAETVERLVEQGWSAAQARAEARRRFGDRARYRRDLEQIDRHRCRKGARMMLWDTAWQNVRSAARGLRRTPGITVAVVVMLALGIGANATMFDIVDRLLLRPPDHVTDAGRLRVVYSQRPTLTLARFARNLTYSDVVDLRGLPALDAVAAFTQPRLLTMGAGSGASKVRAQLAEASYFGTLGVRPVLGRFYGASEDEPGAALTAVLSERFWKRELGGDPGVLGRVIAVSRGRYEVVGIAPEGFTGADLSAVDVWLPLRAAMNAESGRAALETRTWWWTSAVVRLRPGMTDEAANAQMTAAHIRARREVERRGGEPYLSKGPASLYGVSIIAARRPNPSMTASVSLWLAGVSAIVLLIACANVANLLLTRGIQMRRELAVRVALGAARRRIVALVLTEATLLAAAGAAAALVVARWSGALARSFLPDIEFSASGMSARLLVFSLIAAAVTVIVAGLLPALQAARTSATEALRSGARGSSARRSRLRGALMVAQTALSVVLLVGAGLFVRSLHRAINADIGFDHEHVIVAGIEGQPGLESARRDALYHEALARVSQLPGVRRAALSIESTIAFGGWSGPGGIKVPGGQLIDDLPDGGPFLYSGTVGFFETLGVPIVRGRAFVAEDFVAGAEPVGMVSETFVRTVWPDRNPIGQCFEMGADRPRQVPEPCRRVVGVFRDFARTGLADKGAVSVAVPTRPNRMSPQALVARVDADRDPSALASLIRQAIGGVSSDIRFVQVTAMSERVDELLEPWRLGATMFLVFGVLALLVAAVGLYSLLAFGVAQRRRELGIRAALGARGADLLWMVMRQASALVIAGLTAGTLVALLVGRFVEDLLFNVRPTDPLVYGVAVVTLGAAGTIAALVPAWRAMAVSPATTLHAE